MDYTVNLKKILSEKQFAYLQSISATARKIMSPELFNHCVGTLNYCFLMADRFLLNRTGSGLKAYNSIGGSKDLISTSGIGGSKDFSTGLGFEDCNRSNGFEHCVSARTAGLKDYTNTSVSGSSSTSTTSSASASTDGRSSYEKSIPVRCFKLAVAAILHDYGKILSFEELKAIAVKEKLRISDFELNCQPILHSFVAPFLLERDFKIRDSSILNSVRMHTTGSVKMSATDKILYISDKIEETRDYEGVEKLRRLSLKDINLCLLEVYKSNIIYVIKGNNVLHPETAKIWNYIHGGLKNAI